MLRVETAPTMPHMTHLLGLEMEGL
jgi:hypothetical protein